MLLAIDPGTTQTGWVLVDQENYPPKIELCGITPNPEMLDNIDFGLLSGSDQLYIEMIASYGMPVGKTVFETCVWIGRFQQAFNAPDEAVYIYRKDVEMFLCNNSRAKDNNIRQAIIDLYPATGGGKIKQIGIKNKPGPLFGVRGDIWAALGVALLACAEK